MIWSGITIVSFTVASVSGDRQTEQGVGTLTRVVTALRVLQAILIVVGIAIAAIPLVALLDLVNGGTGLGLCLGGLGGCSGSYFTGLELLAVLTLALFVVVSGIALCDRLLRRLASRYDEHSQSDAGESWQ